MKPLPLLITFTFFVSCNTSKITVVDHKTKTKLDQSFFYALPRNTLEFAVKIKQTVLIRGPKYNRAMADTCLSRLAEKYEIEKDDLKSLQTTDTLKKATLEKDGLTVTQGNKPDTNKIYAINIIPKFYQDNITGLTFTQDWLLTEATLSSENKSWEIALSSVSALAGVVGLFTKGSSDTIPADICPNIFKDLDNSIQFMEDFIKNADKIFNSDAYNGAKAQFQKKIDKEFSKVLYEKKEKLVSVKLSMDLPNTLTFNNAIALFRIDKTGKLMINKAYEQFIKISSPDKEEFVNPANENDWYTLKVTKSTDDVYSAINTKLSNPAGESGLVYNIPAAINIMVTQPKTNTVLAFSPFKFAQFGKLGYLDQKLNKITVTLDPITGSLTKVSAESKSFGTSNISGTADAISKVHDTLKKPTETEELEKKAKILELKAKIKDLEAKQ